MPFQNRVPPFGGIVAIPQRAMFTGNRGIIHDRNPDPAETTLGKQGLARLSLRIRGPACDGSPRQDQDFPNAAVVLAVDHRPCFVCHRQAAEAFRDTWAMGRAAELPRTAEMDAVLRTERLESGRKDVWVAWWYGRIARRHCDRGCGRGPCAD
jgi:hypothetical protein